MGLVSEGIANDFFLLWHCGRLSLGFAMSFFFSFFLLKIRECLLVVVAVADCLLIFKRVSFCLLQAMSLVPKGMTCSCCGRLSLGFQCVLFSFLFVSYNANCKSFFMLWQAVSWFFNSLCNVFFSEEDPFSLNRQRTFSRFQ